MIDATDFIANIQFGRSWRSWFAWLKYFWKYCKFEWFSLYFQKYCMSLVIEWLGLLRYFWKYCINRKWFGSLNLLCGASPILLCPAHCPRSAILDICEWFFIRIHTDFVFVFVFMNGSFSILIQTLYLYLCKVFHQNSYRPFLVSCSKKEGG